MARGIDCIVYRDTATYASPTYQEVRNIKDLQLADSFDTADVSTRHERGLSVFEPTMEKVEYTGMMREPEITAAAGDPTFDDHLAFQTAYDGRTALHLEILTGGRTTNGSRGYNGFFFVTKWDQDQSNGVSLFRNFTLTPAPVPAATLAATPAAEAMRKVLVAAGAATYANIGSTTYA